VFAAVFGLGLVLTYVMTPDAVRERLHGLGVVGSTSAGGVGAHWIERFVKLTGPLARLSIPEEGWEQSPLRIRFMNAGFRGPSAPMVFFGAKSLLALGLPALAFVYMGLAGLELAPAQLLLVLTLLAAFGYYLPNAVLARLRRWRQRDIVEAFPDALDLMTICVEAGLGLDAALLRVDVDALVAMLIQAERFGTSVADSLRVQSDALRTRRRLRAEETAAKIPTKLLFPLIFCVFPSMLVVLLGPAFLRLARTFFPLVQAMQ
jgi:tight adherence protein C